MSIQITIKNLGPVREASVELRPLTILVGENNTGKTILATVIQRVLDPGPVLGGGFRRNLAETRIPSEIEGLIRQTGRSSASANPQLPIHEPENQFGPEALAWASTYLKTVLEEYAETVRQAIAYAFAATPKALCRRVGGKNLAKASHVEICNTGPDWKVRIRFDQQRIHVEPPDPTVWLGLLLAEMRKREDVFRLQYESLDRFLYRPFYGERFPGLFLDWPARSVHLPAGRTGIMQSYQILASSVVRQSAMAGIRAIEVPSFTGTVADFLSLVINGGLPRSTRSGPDGSPKKQSKGIRDLIRIFERNTGISIHQEGRPGSSPGIAADTLEGRFPLTLASSMVSEIAPIMLALKGGVSPGDNLVVDEPEAHLHPSMQREAARLFAGLTNLGVGLVVTTHSDFFAGELNNMIRASAGEFEPTQLSFDLDRRVKPRRVAALLFERTGDGTTARSLPIDPIDGFDESTFLAEMSQMYADSLAIADEVSRE